jgi:transcriptional regulator NrdR family protein
METKFKCPYCDEKIKRLVNLKSHIFRTHLKYKYYCPYCSIQFNSLHLLQIHLLSKNDKFHRNLYHLLTRRHFRYVNKNLFLEN